MRYLDVTLTDLNREFQLARSKPRHLTPQPKIPVVPLRAGLDGVIDALSGARHVLEMFRRTLPDGPTRTRLDRLSNRLTKIVTAAKSLGPAKLGQRLAGKAREIDIFTVADRHDEAAAVSFPVAGMRDEDWILTGFFVVHAKSQPLLALPISISVSSAGSSPNNVMQPATCHSGSLLPELTADPGTMRHSSHLLQLQPAASSANPWDIKPPTCRDADRGRPDRLHPPRPHT